MQPYALLMIAASWHALGVGTVGLRGRIVAGICAAGFLWGALTPPWGWVQIGAAVATVAGIRWCATDHGRATLVAGGGRLIGWTADTLRGCCRAVALVLSPPRTHGGPVVELSDPVPTPGETRRVALPHGDRWGMLGPGRSEVDTAQVAPLVPLETYAGVIGDTAAGVRPFNATARYVKDAYGKSRSTFARDVARARSGERKVAC